MEAKFFVDALKDVCRDAAVQDCIATYVSPPGRRPNAELVELSTWYNALSKNDQAMVMRAMKDAADGTLFGVLCVLDGVRSIENTDTKTSFRLIAQSGDEENILCPSTVDLHDLSR
jgi:hypothetical protein